MILFKRFPKLIWRPQWTPQILEPKDQANYPAFAADFAVLETELMNEFRTLDNEAQRAQNAFRREQVILILGGALVTALGALQVTVAALELNNLGPGLAEAVLAAVLAGVANYARTAKSQEHYFGTRLKAEALRGEYFRFLGRVGRYADEQHRKQHLQRRVVEITSSDDSQKSSLISIELFASSEREAGELSEQERLFCDLYQKYRHEDQLDFYTKRQKEFETAESQASLLNIALMTLAAIVSLLASANLLDLSTWWAALAVIFPVLATALSTYQSVYAFDHQAKLYKDAVVALRYVKAYQAPIVNEGVSLEDYVERVESIFKAEQGQWGQLISQIKGASAPGIENPPGEAKG